MINDMLLRQFDILKLLRKNGIVSTCKKQTFSEAVERGVIPYTTSDDSKIKLYKYQDVVDAIQRAGICGSSKSSLGSIDDLPLQDKNESAEEYHAKVVELGAEPTLTDANIYKTIYAGKLEKLKYEQLVETLISRDEVEDKAFSTARIVRDKLLSIPDRMASELASMDSSHEIKELLFKEFNILLSGFEDSLK